MRYDLEVPYLEKDEAKSLGAWWDPKQKVWYVKNPVDINDFSRWLPKKHHYSINHKSFAVTEPSGGFKPLCDCKALPWEDCPHTEALAQQALKSLYGIRLEAA